MVVHLFAAHTDRRNEQEDHGLRPGHPNESLETHELWEGVEIHDTLFRDRVKHPQEVQGNANADVVHHEDPEVAALGRHGPFVPDTLKGADSRDNCTRRTQEDIPFCYNIIITTFTHGLS